MGGGEAERFDGKLNRYEESIGPWCPSCEGCTGSWCPSCEESIGSCSAVRGKHRTEHITACLARGGCPGQRGSGVALDDRVFRPHGCPGQRGSGHPDRRRQGGGEREQAGWR